MRLFIAMVVFPFLILSAAECACIGGNTQKDTKDKVFTRMPTKVSTGMLIAGHRAHDDPMHPHYCGATTPDAQKGE